MIDPLIRNLQSDIALLQLYIAQRKQAGFHDMERIIESLTIFMFRALKMGELVNMNQISMTWLTGVVKTQFGRITSVFPAVTLRW